jgi:hypothetical protein
VPQGLGKLGFGKLRVDGLIGWGAVWIEAQRRGEPLPKSNSHPWLHLGDLAEIRDQLARRLGLRVSA